MQEIRLPSAIEKLTKLRFSLTTFIEKNFNENRLKRPLDKRGFKIDSDETWGCTYLEPKSQSLFVDAIAAITNAIAYQSKYPIKKATVIRQMPKENLADIKAIVAVLKKDAPKLARLDYDQYYIKYFEEAWSKSSRLKKEIQTIKSQWEQDKVLYLYSSPALVFMLNHITLILPHIKAAKKELKFNQHSMPSVIAKGYKHYLDQLNKELSLLKASILSSITIRLKLADEYIKVNPSKTKINDDILVSVLQQLKDIQRLPAHIHIPTFHSSCSKDTMAALIAALYQHGDAQQKKVLYSLHWFKGKEVHHILNNMWQWAWHTLTRRIVKLKILPSLPLIIPTEMKNYVPRFKVWPQWLAKDRNACADFIQRNQALFVTLDALLPPSMPYEAINALLESINYFNNAENELSKTSIIGKQHQQFIAITNQLIRGKLVKLKTALVEQIERISHNEVTPLERKDCDKRWRELQPIFEQVNLLISNEDDHFSNENAHSLAIKLRRAKHTLLNKLQQTPEAFIFDCVYGLAHGDKINGEDINACVDYLFNFWHGEGKDIAQLLNAYRREDCRHFLQAAAQTLLKKLKTQLDIFMLTDEVKQQYELFLELSNPAQQTKFTTIIQHKIVLFIDSIFEQATQGSLDFDKCADALEAFMMQFGKQTFASIVTKLQAKRKMNDRQSYFIDIEKLASQLASERLYRYIDKEAQKATQVFSHYLQQKTQDKQEQQFCISLVNDLALGKSVDDLRYSAKAIAKHLTKNHGQTFMKTLQTMGQVNRKIHYIKNLTGEDKWVKLNALRRQVRSTPLLSGFFQKANITRKLEVNHHARINQNNYKI